MVRNICTILIACIPLLSGGQAMAQGLGGTIGAYETVQYTDPKNPGPPLDCTVLEVHQGAYSLDCYGNRLIVRDIYLNRAGDVPISYSAARPVSGPPFMPGDIILATLMGLPQAEYWETCVVVSNEVNRSNAYVVNCGGRSLSRVLPDWVRVDPDFSGIAAQGQMSGASEQPTAADLSARRPIGQYESVKYVDRQNPGPAQDCTVVGVHAGAYSLHCVYGRFTVRDIDVHRDGEMPVAQSAAGPVFGPPFMPGDIVLSSPMGLVERQYWQLCVVLANEVDRSNRYVLSCNGGTEYSVTPKWVRADPDF